MRVRPRRGTRQWDPPGPQKREELHAQSAVTEPMAASHNTHATAANSREGAQTAGLKRVVKEGRIERRSTDWAWRRCMPQPRAAYQTRDQAP